MAIPAALLAVGEKIAAFAKSPAGQKVLIDVGSAAAIKGVDQIGSGGGKDKTKPAPRSFDLNTYNQLAGQGSAAEKNKALISGIVGIAALIGGVLIFKKK